ncbi:DNA gyrase subunit A [Candidatus Mycoplasma haematobovis]|uniref:DNA topoisomerase (ATP-hydrolyzing) n=1 Tax=Candidatus Mycoplasma haematobovis TaxID=432608 RepID=A0A1A9QF27_9MOLU|nr:DNA topoisomerase (ATP-hydrolyzing) [Candidatus Mycoplasma haematobovis]OAL10309.1 DNA gyrase subunit A [Candidatus Mycoplasma haematobovis]
MSSTRQKTIEKIIKSLDKDTVLDRNIVSEVEQSFLDYAMSVITARALPDLKDGLKPVHRRIIYAAYQERLFHDAKFKKSASLVGTVMGSYHPHGDSSIYDALVRMAQDFSLRYPLIEGQGNFGSIDGDSPAAMRYTEARLSKLGKYFLDGIEEECVDFMDNYDQSRKEPVVLPTLIPNILINGSTGIAVGLATNIPPHNITEVFDAILALIKNPDLTLGEISDYIKGPDFPTGGEIFKYSGVRDYFSTGSGTFKLRSKIEVEEQQKRNLFIIKEIPYGVKKTKIIGKIVSLIKPSKSGKVLVPVLAENIVDIRDESNLEGIRLVVECKNDISKQVILNNLYKFTQLQTSYSPNLTVLINNEPRKISILELLKLYLEHQLEMLKRRTIYQLGVLAKRLHILEGRIKISSDIMEAIRIVNTSDNPEEEIQKKYELSQEQLEDIFKLTIGSLKKISVDKLQEEHTTKTASKISKEELLASEEKMKEKLSQDILELREKFGDERRTRINETNSGRIDFYQLFHFKKIIISLTKKGYLSQIPLETFRLHKRGGIGVKGAFVHKDDAPKMLLVCFGSDDVLFFSDAGKVYRKKAYEMNLSTNKNKSSISYNVLQGMDKNEKIITIISLERDDYLENKYLFFATKNGIVKKTKLSMFARINVSGKKAIRLKDGDALKFVIKIEENSQICLASSAGRMVKFDSKDLRPRSRNTFGVYGLRLKENQELVSASSTAEGEYVLSISENGKGKLTHIDDFNIVKLGRKVGTKAQRINEKTGNILACTIVNTSDEILLMTNSNKLNRFRVSDISVQNRVTSGVKLFNLDGKEKLVYFAKNFEGGEEEEEVTNENQ